MRLALAVLVAALGIALVLAASGDDSSDAPSVPADQVRQAIRDGVLVEAPAAIREECRFATAFVERRLPARCPEAIPAADGEWGRARALDRHRCQYLVDVEPRALPKRRIFHLLLGGRCGRFDLRAREGRWPAQGFIPNDLRLVGVAPLKPGESGRGDPARPRVMQRFSIGGRPALLLRHAPQPLTSVHTGHLAVVWNEPSAAYVVSGHLPDGATAGQEQDAIRAVREAALAMHTSEPVAVDRAERP